MKKILKFQDLYKKPFLCKQHHGGSCGPNVMKKIIAYKLGIHVPEHQLINISCCSFANGASIDGMVKIANEFNLNHDLKHNSSIEEIISSINNNNPVVLLIRAWGNGHYIAANGYDNKFDKIFYYDPFDGKIKSMKYSTLNEKWHGLDVFERNHFGIFFKD